MKGAIKKFRNTIILISVVHRKHKPTKFGMSNLPFSLISELVFA